jgi:hypothetical protein
MNEVHLVIRSAGERTASVCKRLAQLQGIRDKDITVVREVPFEAALRATYLTGLNAGKKWTATLDADVLLAEDSIAALLWDAEQMPSSYAQIEGRIFDKVTGIYRQAGHRIYRTSCLSFALEKIPALGTEIRPEFFVLQQLGQSGSPSRRVERLVGLHDFEQYYGDLYRKALLHSKKHASFVPRFLERCAMHMQADLDFAVILKGIQDGLLYSGSMAIDRRQFSDSVVGSALSELDLKEKREITDEAAFVEGFASMFRLIRAQYPVPEFAPCDDPGGHQTLLGLAARKFGETQKSLRSEEDVSSNQYVGAASRLRNLYSTAISVLTFTMRRFKHLE